jgi:hypothetical protein
MQGRLVGPNARLVVAEDDRYTPGAIIFKPC